MRPFRPRKPAVWLSASNGRTMVLAARESDRAPHGHRLCACTQGFIRCPLPRRHPLSGPEHHEQVGRAVALVFVIDPRRLPFLHRHRGPCFQGELLGGFIQTNQGTIRIVRPCVHGQHVLHGGYEGAVCFGRDDPLCFEMRLELSFFKTRPIVLSLARSTMSSSTTLLSSIRKVQRERPFGGLEQANAISLASFSPSKIGSTDGLDGFLRLRTASRPSSTSC